MEPCNWDGPADERSIRHIVQCEECRERWPAIAEQPAAAIELLAIRRLANREGEEDADNV